MSRSESPETWSLHADSDAPIVTQWDDGKHEGPGPGIVPTSSASMPSVVFSMLHDLDVEPGHRALEIGTGTGWNTALLAHRLGRRNVISVEVDPEVARHARNAIVRGGYGGTVITGDGTQGYAAEAPYDRIIATCGMRRIPFAWVQQARPRGIIVAPWGTHFTHQDATLRLTVADDGRSASGPFTGPVEFMKLRGDRGTTVQHYAYVPNGVGGADQTTTAIPENDVLGGQYGAARFALGLRVPACTQVAAQKANGTRPVWFYGADGRSWAVVMFQDGAEDAAVWQSGPRRLWDEVEAAAQWWTDQGRPAHERFGLTVTDDGHQVWLDTPRHSWAVQNEPAAC